MADFLHHLIFGIYPALRAAEIVQNALLRDGVTLFLGASIEGVGRGSEGKRLRVRQAASASAYIFPGGSGDKALARSLLDEAHPSSSALTRRRSAPHAHTSRAGSCRSARAIALRVTFIANSLCDVRSAADCQVPGKFRCPFKDELASGTRPDRTGRA